MINDTPTASGRIVLVGGGARSGKSSFALRRGRELGQRRAFLATAQALDGEMAERIEEHARTRGADFRTIEEPIAIAHALAVLAAAEIDVVVIDCITLWLSNLLIQGRSEADVLREVDELAVTLDQRRFHVVMVTNEVGMGLVPETPLGRAFRDVSGRTHQVLAAQADEVHLAVLGACLRLKPAPLIVHTGQGNGDQRGTDLAGPVEP